MDTPVFLSKEEKRQAMKYMDMINSLGNSNILVNEPKIDLF